MREQWAKAIAIGLSCMDTPGLPSRPGLVIGCTYIAPQHFSIAGSGVIRGFEAVHARERLEPHNYFVFFFP